ncbi:hypothetical protein Holit_02508 [Hollandina sp. SP2]
MDELENTGIERQELNTHKKFKPFLWNRPHRIPLDNTIQRWISLWGNAIALGNPIRPSTAVRSVSVTPRFFSAIPLPVSRSIPGNYDPRSVLSLLMFLPFRRVVHSASSESIPPHFTGGKSGRIMLSIFGCRRQVITIPIQLVPSVTSSPQRIHPIPACCNNLGWAISVVLHGKQSARYPGAGPQRRILNRLREQTIIRLFLPP